MNKSNVDEMLLQMIAHKVRETQEKFSRGEALSSADVNTLLLKSQYNNINHLDEKLNDVTADVSSLKHSFEILDTKVNSRLDLFEKHLDTFEKNIDFKIQKAVNDNMKWSIGVIALLVAVLKLIDVIMAKLPNFF